MKTLRISDTLALPVDILTESTAVLAKKGAGKTNGGVVIVEEAFRCGVPVVIIDPKGDWWGIRAGSDGSPDGGLPIPVFGGLHGDIPLEPTAGAYIADLVRERGLSVLLDVSEFETNADRRRFLTAFADRLYRHPSREPMHLMLEEAHEYIPQGVSGEDAKMVGVFERIVKLGRAKGLGITMMTQRSASLNKNVLTQVDNLFMLRTGSPQDRAAVQAWMSGHGEAKQIVDALPALATGEFWLWQPERGEPVHARFRMRSTYDAGATPKIGETPRPPATLADVDLPSIRTAMAATIEKVKGDDPKALRSVIGERDRTIASLQRELEVERVKPAPEPTLVEVSVITDDDRNTLSNQANLLHQAVLDLMSGAMTDIALTADKLLALAEPTRTPPALRLPPIRHIPVAAPSSEKPTVAPVPQRARPAGDGDSKLGKAARAVLTTLATYGTRTHVQLAILAGYSSTSGGFRNTLSALRSVGHIIGGKDAIDITDEGRAALGEYEPLPTGQALIDHWKAQVGQSHRAIIDALLYAYPNSLTHDEVADITNYQPTSGGFRNSLSKLRTLEIIHGGRDAITISPTLGEAAQP